MQGENCHIIMKYEKQASDVNLRTQTDLLSAAVHRHGWIIVLKIVINFSC